MLHWPFADPAEATGDEQQILDTFRAIRNQISSKIQEYLDGDQQVSD